MKGIVLVREPGRGATTVAGSALYGALPQMLPVANRPLLTHTLDAIEAAGLSSVAVVTDAVTAPAVRSIVGDDPRWGVLGVEVHEAPSAGLGATLSAMRAFVDDEPFLLHLADSLQKGGLHGLVSGERLGSSDARVLTCEGPRHGHFQNGALRRSVEPLRPLREPPDHAGVYVLGSRALDVAASAAEATDGEVDAAGLVRTLGELGGRVETFNTHGGWRVGHRLEGWLEGNRLALEGLEPDHSAAELYDTDIQGGVVIHPSAAVRSSVVRGPAVIGPMARLTDAYVGPYSSIGAGVLIEAAEIENSIILPGASIRYLGGRLEASIIGPRARVFRDFRLPKALRVSIGEGAEVALV